MHQNSYNIMARFAEKYVKSLAGASVLDIGSCKVQPDQPTYKPLFPPPKFAYVGLDLCKGDNVDIVVEKPYSWPLESGSYDIVISGQCLEHTTAPWIWIKEVERLVKPGGLVAIIAPWMWGQHRYPIDCWRILPDGMTYLLGTWCDFEILDVGSNGPEIACDCWGFGKKKGGAPAPVSVPVPAAVPKVETVLKEPTLLDMMLKDLNS